MKNLTEFDTCIKFTFQFNKESIVVFDIKVSLKITTADLKICQYLPKSFSSYENVLKDVRLKHLLICDIGPCAICEKFVCKHSETIEYVNNYPTFYKHLQS